MHVVRDGSKLQVSQLGPDFLLLDEADDFEGPAQVILSVDGAHRESPRDPVVTESLAAEHGLATEAFCRRPTAAATKLKRDLTVRCEVNLV